MVRGKNGHAEADPDPPGHLTERAEQDLGTWRTREPCEEVMLDEPEVVESHAVGEHALLERFLVERVPLDARALERSLRFVEQAESHGRSSSCSVPEEPTTPVLARRIGDTVVPCRTSADPYVPRSHARVSRASRQSCSARPCCWLTPAPSRRRPDPHRARRSSISSSSFRRTTRSTSISRPTRSPPIHR